MVVVSNPNEPVVTFQDPGTGTSNHNDPNSAAMFAGPLGTVALSGRRVSGMGLSVDTSNNTIGIGSGTAIIELPSNVAVQASAGGNYSLNWYGPTAIVASIDNTTGITADTTSGVCGVWLDVDETSDNSVEIVNANQTTQPSEVTEPYIYLGTVDTSTGEIDEDVIYNPNLADAKGSDRYLPNISAEQVDGLRAKFGAATYFTYGGSDIVDISDGSSKVIIDDPEYQSGSPVDINGRIHYIGLTSLSGAPTIQSTGCILDGMDPGGQLNYLTLEGDRNMVVHSDDYVQVNSSDNVLHGFASPSEVTMASATIGNVVTGISGTSPNITDNDGRNTIGVVDKGSAELSDLVYEESNRLDHNGKIWKVHNDTELSNALSNAPDDSTILLLSGSYTTDRTISTSYRFIGSESTVITGSYTVDAACKFESLWIGPPTVGITWTINATSKFRDILFGRSDTTIDLQCNDNTLYDIESGTINNGSGYTGQMVDMARNTTFTGDTGAINTGLTI